MFKLKIDLKAYNKLVYLRDYKPYEVSVLGETLVSDPLHVVDVHLVKQEVDSVTTDMCPVDITRHTEDMLDRGILPINSERVWMHTHPMTGANSADPSTKDMATWAHEDNKLKNFLVMFILSKSGEMTCRMRVKVTPDGGLPPFFYEEKIAVEIIRSQADGDYLKSKLTEIWGERTVNTFDINDLFKKTDIEEIYPEFNGLKDQYAQLVSPIKQKYTNDYTHNHIGYNSYSKKRKARKRDVPEMLLTLGKKAETMHGIDWNRARPIMDKFDVSILEIERLETEFFASRQSPSYSSFIRGLINADILNQDKINLHSSHITDFLCNSEMTYPEFECFAEEFNNASAK